uniref:Uncharacterized protein n=1 Tax=viral metagenome TaxID=1070528 RepID=A0A6C0F749_9ZZZZ|tara:strand:+ start:6991 stop:7188 length:198 start_codon:yes stop_codon:yes gene_type:complete
MTIPSLIIEAVVVGVVMSLLYYGFNHLLPKKQPMKLVFIVGFIGHLLFELMGANKWYCKHGTACK